MITLSLNRRGPHADGAVNIDTHLESLAPIPPKSSQTIQQQTLNSMTYCGVMVQRIILFITERFYSLHLFHTNMVRLFCSRAILFISIIFSLACIHTIFSTVKACHGIVASRPIGAVNLPYPISNATQLLYGIHLHYFRTPRGWYWNLKFAGGPG